MIPAATRVRAFAKAESLEQTATAKAMGGWGRFVTATDFGAAGDFSAAGDFVTAAGFDITWSRAVRAASCATAEEEVSHARAATAGGRHQHSRHHGDKTEVHYIYLDKQTERDRATRTSSRTNLGRDDHQASDT
jgi:hypothetical protein